MSWHETHNIFFYYQTSWMTWNRTNHLSWSQKCPLWLLNQSNPKQPLLQWPVKRKVVQEEQKFWIFLALWASYCELLMLRLVFISCCILAMQFETWENSSSFSSVPASKVDAMGKERFIGKETSRLSVPAFNILLIIINISKLSF